jgi:diguanylate cyclase (GGDEF)-like protein
MEKSQTAVPKSAHGPARRDATPKNNNTFDTSLDLKKLLQVAEGMEQGLLVWGEDGKCMLYTQRVMDLLEMRRTDLFVGIDRSEFFKYSLMREELTPQEVEQISRQFSRHSKFQYDSNLRSGRVISTRARPFRDAGFIVTLTDVTEERQKSIERDASVQLADEARRELAVTLQKEKARQYETGILNEFADWLQTCKTLDELYEIVRTYLSHVLPGSQGELYIYSNSRDVLDGVLCWGRDNLQNYIEADSCWGLRRGRSYIYNKEEISFECAHVAAVKHLPIQKYTCIPIVAHGDTVGLMHIRYSGSGASSEMRISDPSAFATKCGELVSLAIANVRLRDELHEQSTRDPLTGLSNRRYCLDLMRQQMQDFARNGTKFSVIAFDADKFKSFNDSFGHDAGDAVLKEIADQMRKGTTPNQISCRFGGEEFLIVLPETELDEAQFVAEELRKSVQDAKVFYANQQLPTVTISCGIATFPTHGENIQDLLRNADLALYRAKEAGRNRCETADGGQDMPQVAKSA